MNNTNSIKKVDAISIVIDNSVKDELLKIFSWDKNRMWNHWILKYETTNKEIILSCVNTQSRDELFELLIENISNDD